MIFILKISEIGIITGLAIVLLIVSMTSIGIINNKNELIQSISLENEELLDNSIKNYNHKLFLESEVERLQDDYKLLQDNYKVLEVKYDKIKRSVDESTVTSRGSAGKVLLGTFEATAYDLSFESCGKHPDHPEYGITASGTKARPGVVAVDPKVIPLGTKLYIEGIGNVVAEDTGGAIKGRIIDIFMSNNQDCKDWGRREIKVWKIK